MDAIRARGVPDAGDAVFSERAVEQMHTAVDKDRCGIENRLAFPPMLMNGLEYRIFMRTHQLWPRLPYATFSCNTYRDKSGNEEK